MTLAGFGFPARRLPPVIDESGIGPWLARVRVVPIELERTRSAGVENGTTFEVIAEWFGPPAYGFPPSLTYVNAEDKWTTENLDLAKRMAAQVIRELRAGEDVPDMRSIAREWRLAEEA